jgi:predicted DsbA family dithiol-disulfide isomerase
VGLDEAAFKSCLADAGTQAEVDAALAFGQKVGVPSVPAFLFFDLKQGRVVADIVGAPTLAEFQSKIDTALNPPTPAPAPTATPTP